MQVQNETVVARRTFAPVRRRPRLYAARRCGGCSRILSGGELKVVISQREASRYLGRKAGPRLNLVCASCFKEFRAKGAAVTTVGYLRNRREQDIYM